MRLRMGLNVDAGIPHLGELLPGHRFAAAEVSAAYAFGVDEQCERVAEFFHNRPGHLILRFPAIIKRDDSASRRDIFLTAFLRQKILHWDYSDAAIFQLLHLLLEGLRSYFGVRPVHLIDETVVAKNDGLRSLIDRHPLWLRGDRTGLDCRRHRDAYRRARRSRSYGRRRRAFTNF